MLPTGTDGGRYVLEALQPCADVWDRIRPPEWWSDDTGTHHGYWEAESERDVVAAFLRAYPNRHPGAKPYRGFRVTPEAAIREFTITEVER